MFHRAAVGKRTRFGLSLARSDYFRDKDIGPNPKWGLVLFLPLPVIWYSRSHYHLETDEMVSGWRYASLRVDFACLQGGGFLRVLVFPINLVFLTWSKV